MVKWTTRWRPATRAMKRSLFCFWKYGMLFSDSIRSRQTQFQPPLRWPLQPPSQWWLRESILLFMPRTRVVFQAVAAAEAATTEDATERLSVTWRSAICELTATVELWAADYMDSTVRSTEAARSCAAASMATMPVRSAVDCCASLVDIRLEIITVWLMTVDSRFATMVDMPRLASLMLRICALAVPAILPISPVTTLSAMSLEIPLTVLWRVATLSAISDRLMLVRVVRSMVMSPLIGRDAARLPRLVWSSGELGCATVTPTSAARAKTFIMMCRVTAMREATRSIAR